MPRFGNMKSARYLAILNITPDSFSDGSQNFRDLGWLLDRAEKLMESGAYALDIGAESTRPEAEPVSAIEEYQRLENFFRYSEIKCIRFGNRCISRISDS